MVVFLENLFRGLPWYLYLVIILSFTLLVVSFFVPPMGVIDGSVLKAVALILGGSWLLYVTANIPTFIESGAKIKASYGNAQIEIGKKEDEQEQPINNDEGDN